MTLIEMTEAVSRWTHDEGPDPFFNKDKTADYADLRNSESSDRFPDDHKEPHFQSADIVRDIVIGLADGLTVPFALAAGLATLDNSSLVVTAGMAGIL